LTEAPLNPRRNREKAAEVKFLFQGGNWFSVVVVATETVIFTETNNYFTA